MRLVSPASCQGVLMSPMLILDRKEPDILIVKGMVKNIDKHQEFLDEFTFVNHSWTPGASMRQEMRTVTRRRRPYMILLAVEFLQLENMGT